MQFSVIQRTPLVGSYSSAGVGIQSVCSKPQLQGKQISLIERKFETILFQQICKNHRLFYDEFPLSRFGLVSLFYGLSTIVGYFVPNKKSCDTI